MPLTMSLYGFVCHKQIIQEDYGEYGLDEPDSLDQGQTSIFHALLYDMR